MQGKRYCVYAERHEAQTNSRHMQTVSAAVSAQSGADGVNYRFDIGMLQMDLVDHYMSAYAMVTVTGVECIVIGWFGNGVIEGALLPLAVT